MIIVIVPSDERGKYVKLAASKSGITEFTNDEFGNIQFEATPFQFEGILNVACIGTYKQPPEHGMELSCLCIDQTHYGQFWNSKEEYVEYKKKTVDAW